MKTTVCSLVILMLLAVPAFSADVSAKLPPLPSSHATRQIEGWNVRVDERLLSGDAAATGEQAIKLLSARLFLISIVVPERPLAKLRQVTIQLDLTHGALRNMQYHPSVAWLKEHVYSEQLAKCVHIPDARKFLSPYENHRMPWVLLHELSHAYHDQVLGFDEPRIRSAYQKFRDGGRYKSVLTSPGPMREHYALTNEKEFFAEMTECYFGTNDFYPFVAGELKQAEPEILLCCKISGDRCRSRTGRKRRINRDEFFELHVQATVGERRFSGERRTQMNSRRISRICRLVPFSGLACEALRCDRLAIPTGGASRARKRGR